MSDPKLKSTNSGIDKFGYNGAATAAEDVWSGGGDFPWANTGANGVTTIDSTSAEDGAGTFTGALTIEVEGLKQVTIKGVTGGQIVRETVAMNGTDAVTLTNQFSFVYRAKVLTTGSNNGPVGAVTILIGGNVIARVEIGTNGTEMAIMVVPQFTSDGGYIHGAYLHNWGGSIVANTAANMGMSVDVAPSGELGFAIQRRGTTTVGNDIDEELHAPTYHKPGSRFRVRVTSVSAGSLLAAGFFTLVYDLG